MPPIVEPQGPPEPGETKPPLMARLLWFAGLWLASLMVVAAVAYFMRALIL